MFLLMLNVKCLSYVHSIHTNEEPMLTRFCVVYTLDHVYILTIIKLETCLDLYIETMEMAYLLFRAQTCGGDPVFESHVRVYTYM
jgi:hypothetical protein